MSKRVTKATRQTKSGGAGAKKAPAKAVASKPSRARKPAAKAAVSAARTPVSKTKAAARKPAKSSAAKSKQVPVKAQKSSNGKTARTGGRTLSAKGKPVARSVASKSQRAKTVAPKASGGGKAKNGSAVKAPVAQKRPAAKKSEASAKTRTPSTTRNAKSVGVAAVTSRVEQLKSSSVKKPMSRAAGKSAGKKQVAKEPSAPIVLPADYRPSEDEPFMNELQRMYFRQKLVKWKEDIIDQTRETIAGLHEESAQHADIADRATSETDRATELRTRDRQRKLVQKIDAALARIEDGSYGYCEETGEPIGLRRLDARPIATLSVEAQERHERRERVYRED